VSAFGLLHPEAANVILTNSSPVNAPNVSAFLSSELPDFMVIQFCGMTNNSNEYLCNGNFLWSFEHGGQFSQAPATGSVYVQAITNSEGICQ